MTPAEVSAIAKERNRVFIASLSADPEGPPHCADPGRPPPDTERYLAAAASRVRHEPVEHVGPSRDRVREAERETERKADRKAAIKPQRKRRRDGLCPRCGLAPKLGPGHSYCRGCLRERQRAAKVAAGKPVHLKPGRPRKGAARNTLNKRRELRRQERRDEVTRAWGEPAVIASTFAA